jgi:hypothetical protein
MTVWSVVLLTIAGFASFAAAGGYFSLLEVLRWRDPHRPSEIVRHLVLIAVFVALALVCALVALKASGLLIAFALALVAVCAVGAKALIEKTATKPLIFHPDGTA